LKPSENYLLFLDVRQQPYDVISTWPCNTNRFLFKRRQQQW